MILIIALIIPPEVDKIYKIMFTSWSLEFELTFFIYNNLLSVSFLLRLVKITQKFFSVDFSPVLSFFKSIDIRFLINIKFEKMNLISTKIINFCLDHKSPED